MDWNRLAQAMVDRRVELGLQSRPALAKHSGMSLRVLADLETAARDNYDPVTISRLEQALEWPAGRVRELLRDAPERLSRDPGTFAMLDAAGRELIPELVDLIHFMSPDSNLDKEGREAARKILYGVVMTLVQLSAQTSEVRRLSGVPEPDFDPGDVEIPDQGAPAYLSVEGDRPEAVDVVVQMYQPRESAPRGVPQS